MSSNHTNQTDSRGLDSPNTGESDLRDLRDPQRPQARRKDSSKEKHRRQHGFKNSQYTYRYQYVLKVIITPILVIAAVLCLVGGILFSTVLRPSPHVAAKTTVSQRYVATAPGVLSLVANKVTVTVTSLHEVCAAVGAYQDVAGWLANRQYTRITGLSTWEKLSTSSLTMGDYPESVAANGDAESGENESQEQSGTSDLAALESSDMWDMAKCGENIVIPLDALESDQSLIIDTQPVTDAQDSHRVSTTTVSFAWTRTSMLNMGLPYYFAACLMIIAAIMCYWLFSLEPHRRRNSTATSHRHKNSEAEHGEPRWVRDHLKAKKRSNRRHRNAQGKKHGLSVRYQGVQAQGVLDGGQDSAQDSPQTEEKPLILNPRGKNMVARLALDRNADADSSDTAVRDASAQNDVGGSSGDGSPNADDEYNEYLLRLLGLNPQIVTDGKDTGGEDLDGKDLDGNESDRPGGR